MAREICVPVCGGVRGKRYGPHLPNLPNLGNHNAMFVESGPPDANFIARTCKIIMGLGGSCVRVLVVWRRDAVWWHTDGSGGGRMVVSACRSIP